jgi:hypothetical protein
MEQQPTNILCLYSSYSSECKKFISKLQKNEIDFVQLIPVDNPEVRRKVVNKVKRVPCLLIEYDTEELEIYEGDKAFDWLEQIIMNKKAEEMRQKALMEQQKLLEDIQREKELLERQKKELEEQKTTDAPPAKKEKYTAIGDVLDDGVDNEREMYERDAAKVSASSKKTQDLLSRARELEKGREDLSSKKPPLGN